jgi:hypothetical protein
VAPEVREIDEAIDLPQQVIFRYMAFKRELVEKRALNDLPITHHRHHPAALHE